MNYVLGGATLLVIILSVLLKGSYERTGELEAKLATQADETLECVAANDSTMATVDTLTTELAELIEERRIDTERREQILVERESDLLRARMENDRLRNERENEQDENADCKNLATLRVDLFCPATADQLRDRSRGPGGNRDTND